MKTNNKFENKKYVKSYFQAEINKLADEMTNAEMVEQLKELEQSRYWIAITKYVQDRMLVAQGSLCVLDPITHAASIARAQGILSGLLDLQDMIIKTKETTKQAEAKANAKNDSSPDVEDADDLMGLDNTAPQY
jgi:hypothetical protein